MKDLRGRSKLKARIVLYVLLSFIKFKHFLLHRGVLQLELVSDTYVYMDIRVIFLSTLLPPKGSSLLPAVS